MELAWHWRGTGGYSTLGRAWDSLRGPCERDAVNTIINLRVGFFCLKEGNGDSETRCRSGGREVILVVSLLVGCVVVVVLSVAQTPIGVS